MLESNRGVRLARLAAHDTVRVDVRTYSLRQDRFTSSRYESSGSNHNSSNRGSVGSRQSGQASLRLEKGTNLLYMMNENVLPSSPVKSPFALAVPVEAEAATVVATPSGKVNFWQQASHLSVSQMGWD